MMLLILPALPQRMDGLPAEPAIGAQPEPRPCLAARSHSGG